MTRWLTAVVAAALFAGSVPMTAQTPVPRSAPFAESSRLGRFIVLSGTRARDASGAIAVELIGHRE